MQRSGRIAMDDSRVRSEVVDMALTTERPFVDREI